MQDFRPYVNKLHDLLIRSTRVGVSACQSDIDAALDGQPWDELRRSVSLTQLRSAGAFFTGSAMAQRAIAAAVSSLKSDATVLDPACGAGDLLVAFIEHLPRSSDLASTLSDWGIRILGRDIEPDFVRATKLRLALAAVRRQPLACSMGLPTIADLFPGICTGSSLTDYELYRRASYIVINPPFTLVDAPDGCTWGAGKVNSAALFMDTCVTQAEPGTRLVAILPDVLRSGSRYEKWRKLFEQHVCLNKLEIFGQFDRVTDVDVFMAVGVINRDGTSRATVPWIPSEHSSITRIRDKFDVSVGAVVPHRDPQKGPWRPFLQARGLAPWEVVSSVLRHRRFLGKTFEPPFVVVRRTSRPGDRDRAVGTLIAGGRSIAVENHLIVLRPKARSLEVCRQLLRILQERTTSEMLDRRIRCRHLTVPSLSELPWRDK